MGPGIAGAAFCPATYKLGGLHSTAWRVQANQGSSIFKSETSHFPVLHMTRCLHVAHLHLDLKSPDCTPRVIQQPDSWVSRKLSLMTKKRRKRGRREFPTKPGGKEKT